MFDQTDQWLVELFKQHEPRINIRLGIPGVIDSKPTLILHLLNLLPSEPSANLGATKGFSCRSLKIEYLVSSSAGSASEAHSLLGRAAELGIKTGVFEPIFRPVEMSMWLAFETHPQAAFFIHVPWQINAEPEIIPSVQEAPEVRVGQV